MKRLLKLLLFVIFLSSLGGNIYQAAKTLDIPMGGGCSKDSPDGRYRAQVNSLRQTNRLRADYDQLYGEFSIDSVSNPGGFPPFRMVRLVPPGTDREMGYYDKPEIMSWSTDSKGATFNVPGMKCTLYIEPITTTLQTARK